MEILLLYYRHLKYKNLIIVILSTTCMCQTYVLFDIICVKKNIFSNIDIFLNICMLQYNKKEIDFLIESKFFRSRRRMGRCTAAQQSFRGSYQGIRFSSFTSVWTSFIFLSIYININLKFFTLRIRNNIFYSQNFNDLKFNEIILLIIHSHTSCELKLW